MRYDPHLVLPSRSQLHLFTGKGGVGKTSVVAAIGLEQAARGRRVLCVELSHRSSLSSVFDRDLAPGTVERIDGSDSGALFAAVLDEPALLEAYAEAVLPSKRLARRIARHPALTALVGAAPGTQELLSLHRLRSFCDEEEPRFDHVLVDLDATGHALMFLSMPHMLRRLLGSGPFRKLLDGLIELLHDPERVRVHVVATPEPMVLSETQALLAQLAELGEPKLGAVLINDQHPPIFEGSARAALETLSARSEATRATRSLLERRLRRELAQQEALEALRHATTGRLIHLPHRGEGGLSTDDLRHLGELACEALSC